MRVTLIAILYCLFSFYSVDAQIYDPVKWTTSCNKIADVQYEITVHADIEDGWNIYSMTLDGDGPIPTELVIESDYLKASPVKESSSKMEKSYDKLFEMDLIKLKHDATYTQRITVKDPSLPITGYITYMVCDKTKCLPPTDQEITLDLATCTGLEKKKITTPNNSTPTSTSTPSAKTSSASTSQTQSTIKPTTNKAAPRPSTEQKTITTTKSAKKAPQEVVVSQKKTTEAAVIKKTEAPENNLHENQASSPELHDPVQWTADLTQKENNIYTLSFKADIMDGWNIYSKDLKEDGPIPTSLIIDVNDSAYRLVGQMRESAEVEKREYDPNFEIELIKIKNGATYEQDLELIGPSSKFGGVLEYMACDIKQCIFPPAVEFIIDNKTKQVNMGEDVLSLLEEDKFKTGRAATALSYMSLDPNKLVEPVGSCKTESRSIIKNKGLTNIFFLGFIGGLLALLTPCVFPMIPLTVSFFTKGSKDKKKGLTSALLYGFFILLVYLLLSLPFHLMDSLNPDILNNISTNVWLNLAFFFIFLFFAFSFFGFYEITLPSSWTNRSSQAEDAGSFLGIFFMALTLALVSFSCTGPILGSLLAGSLSSDGGAMQLTAGMAGFGFALALPFALFAAFPSFLNKLPHSGGWLTTVKVILGFLELALAFKFLSNADLVKDWGLLKIEPFLIIEILIFIGLGLYALGKIKFPHDGPIKKLSVTRKSIGILSFLFVIYLASGFRFDNSTGTFSPLTLLSGLAPPVGYSWIYPNKCPQNLNCFKDFEDGQAYAIEQNKPILIDFTGKACVNCRKMEENVWPKPEIIDMIDNDYVLISLYVDYREKLEKPIKVTSSTTGKDRTLRTVGDKWSFMQQEYFKTNSQPYYVLLSPDGQLLNNSVPYTPDAAKYASFLKCGLENFKKL